MALDIEQYLKLRDQIVDELSGLIHYRWMDEMVPTWFSLIPTENPVYEQLELYCRYFRIQQSDMFKEHDVLGPHVKIMLYRCKLYQEYYQLSDEDKIILRLKYDH